MYTYCLRCGHPIGAAVEATSAQPVTSKTDHYRRNAVLVAAGLFTAYLLLLPKGTSSVQPASATDAPVAAAATVLSTTRAPTPKPTPTLAPTPSPTPDRAAAQYVDPRLLVSDPKAFVGQNIYVQGKALNVEQRAAVAGGLFTTARAAYTWIQVLAQIRGKDSFTNESVVVELVPPDKTFLKDECYRVYGIVRGTQTVRLLLTGAEREVPVIEGYAHERVAAGQYNLGCVNP